MKNFSSTMKNTNTSKNFLYLGFPVSFLCAFHPCPSSSHCKSIVQNRQDDPEHFPDMVCLLQSWYKKPERAHTLTLCELFLESLGCVGKNYQSNQNNLWYNKQSKTKKKTSVFHPHAVVSPCSKLALPTQARTCTAC